MIDVELYGGRRAYVVHLRSRALYALGAYSSARNVEWESIARLVFVCHGNICRSPYACARASMLGVNSVSFGLEALNGARADEPASRNALLRGVDLSAHRSIRLEESLIERGDLVVVFEPRHLAKVRGPRAADLAGITLMGIWTEPIRAYVHDPFGMSDRYFQQCFSAIDLNIQELVTRIATHEAPAGGAGNSRLVGTAPSPKSLPVRPLSS